MVIVLSLALDGEACEFEGETRLVREDSTLGDSEGSVEICIDRQWGAVCDDGWDVNAAMVVCKEHDLLTEGTLAWCKIKITMFSLSKLYGCYTNHDVDTSKEVFNALLAG